MSTRKELRHARSGKDGTFHNDSITEKIRLLREDIHTLFPATSSRRNESASPRSYQ